MKKVQMFVNKPVFLGPSILELSEIVMYEFQYNQVKPKYKMQDQHKYEEQNYVTQILTVLQST